MDTRSTASSIPAQAEFDTSARANRPTRRGLLGLAAGLAATGLFSGPAASQAKNFIIFFDRGQSKLTPMGLKLVDEIKKQIGATSGVKLTGHCDTSEPGAMKLGLARATAVRTALTAAGVPASVKISVSSKGDKDLLAPTGPQTREPQNRRVEIAVN